MRLSELGFTLMSTSNRKFFIAHPRVYFGESISIGPGKVALLRKIDEKHSIAAAAKELGIPYKRAWSLIESLNQGFGRPVVQTSAGGKGGGGTVVTDLGHAVIQRYEALEISLNTVVSAALNSFDELLL